ncbi:MAG: glycosyltransferase family 4 protein [Planctomycetota bacterium]|jgi:hypothetical protein
MEIVAWLDGTAGVRRFVAGITPALAALGHTVRTTADAAAANWNVAGSGVAAGVDRDRFRPSAARTQERSALRIASSDCAVVMARDLEMGCGATSLADALARVRGRCPDLRTAIVGDGPIRSAVEQQLHVTGAEDRCRCIGAVSDDTRARWLTTADVVVAHATTPEPFGLSLREALACGTPVLAGYESLGAEPPHPDLHLETGRAAELAAKLIRWYEDRDALAALRDACAAHPLATRTWEDAARDLVAGLQSTTA